MSNEDGNNPQSLKRRDFLRLAALTGGGFAGSYVAGSLGHNAATPAASAPTIDTSGRADKAYAAESEGLRQEIQKHIGGLPGITDISIIDDDSSPHHNAVYTKVYNKLRELLPEEKRAEFPKPTAVAFESTEDNAWNVVRSLREKGIVALTSKAYDASDDKLTYLFGHELGHALYRYDAKLAEELGGLNNPAVQPMLKKMKQRVAKLFKDPQEATLVYDNLRGELMADGISLKVSGDPTVAIAWLKKSTQNNESSSVDDFIGSFALPKNSLREIKRALTDIQERIRTEGIQDHPSDNERAQYVELLARDQSFLNR